MHKKYLINGAKWKKFNIIQRLFHYTDHQARIITQTMKILLYRINYCNRTKIILLLVVFWYKFSRS